DERSTYLSVGAHDYVHRKLGIAPHLDSHAVQGPDLVQIVGRGRVRWRFRIGRSGRTAGEQDQTRRQSEGASRSKNAQQTVKAIHRNLLAGRNQWITPRFDHNPVVAARILTASPAKVSLGTQPLLR